MITGLDHVVVLAGDIAAGTAAYETLFARSPSWRNSGDGADRTAGRPDGQHHQARSQAQAQAGTRAQGEEEDAQEGARRPCHAGARDHDVDAARSGARELPTARGPGAARRGQEAVLGRLQRRRVQRRGLSAPARARAPPRPTRPGS